MATHVTSRKQEAAAAAAAWQWPKPLWSYGLFVVGDRGHWVLIERLSSKHRLDAKNTRPVKFKRWLNIRKFSLYSFPKKMYQITILNFSTWSEKVKFFAEMTIVKNFLRLNHPFDNALSVWRQTLCNILSCPIRRVLLITYIDKNNIYSGSCLNWLFCNWQLS